MRKIFTVLVLLLAAWHRRHAVSGVCRSSLPVEKELSWWTVFYERPNPERLPDKGTSGW